MNLIPLTIEVSTVGADKSVSDMDRVTQSARKMSDSAKQVKTDLTSAFGPSVTSNDVFGPIVPKATAAASATNLLGKEMQITNGFSKDVRDTLRTMHPVLTNLGGSFGQLGMFAGVARVGIIGLGAAVAGSLIAAMMNAEGVAANLAARLNAIGGASGGVLLKNLTAAADAAKVPISSLSGAFETLVVAQQKAERESGVVYGSLSDGSKKIGEALQTVALAAKLGGAVSSEIAKLTTDFATSMAKNKGLTAGLFDQLVSQAPTVALAIAKAFGASSIVDFAIRLGDTTIPMNKVIEQLARYRAEQEKLTAEKPNTLAQAWDNFTTSVGKAFAEFSKYVGLAEKFDVVGRAINKMATDPQGALDDLRAKIAELGAEIRNLTSNILGVVWDTLVAGANAAAGAISSLIAKLYEYAAAPKPSSAVGGGSAIATGGNGTAGGDFSNIGSQYNNFSDQLNSVLGETNFATGGNFQVQGTGGTDSQRVSFMATPGENVSITPPTGTNQVSATGFAGGGDFTVPNTTSASGDQVGGNIDSVLTSSSQSLVDTIRKMSDELAGLGLNEEGVKSVISGAGENKMPDVIRLGTIQTTTAITQSADKIVNAIMTGDINLSNSINALSSSLASAAAASSGSGSSSGGVSGGDAGPGAMPTEFSPTGWVNDGSGWRPGGAPAGIQRFGPSSGSGGLDAGSKAALAASNKASAEIDAYYKSLPPGTFTSSGQSGSQAEFNKTSASIPSPSTTGYSATPGLTRPTPLSQSMVQANYESSLYGESAGVEDISAGYAGGADFEVPFGFDRDSYPMRVQSGEHVKVTPKSQVNNNGGQQRAINVYMTVYAKDADSFNKSKAQTANDLRLWLDNAVRHI